MVYLFVKSTEILSTVLIFLVALLPFELTFISNAYSAYIENPYFSQEIFVIAKDDEGNLLPGAKVYLYAIGEKGLKLLGERISGATGIASFRHSFPLSYYGTHQLNGKLLNVYSSVNLMVIVNKGELIGLYTFPIDPTFEAGIPKVVEVKTYRIPAVNPTQKEVFSSYNEQVLNEWYQYTQVLKFSTYYGIKALWFYPIGSKIQIQTLWTYPPGTSLWRDGGYVEITLDSGIGTNPDFPRTGPYLWSEYFEFKYRHSIVYGSLNIEYLYAVDTGLDPRSDQETKENWYNTPVDGQYYEDLSQGKCRQFNVTGGYNYDFSVAISLGFPWSVSVTLGVSKNPAPISTLTICTEEWAQGYVARVVSLNDRDFLDSRTFWVNQNQH